MAQVALVVLRLENRARKLRVASLTLCTSWRKYDLGREMNKMQSVSVTAARCELGECGASHDWKTAWS